MSTTQITHWVAGHGILASAIAAAAVTVLGSTAVMARSFRRAGREKVITGLINIAAMMATSVQASGMWKFFGNTMGLPVGFRIVLFAFMEIALLATGLRARANVAEGGDAGIDGVLVWVLALASGLMSSTDASSAREGAMRVLVAVVVSLLWTRDLMAAKSKARKAAAGRKAAGPIRWRITSERIFVWLRLADAVDTDVSAIDAGRRMARFLKKQARARDGWAWPFTAKASARREALRMDRDALMRYGDPTAVYGALARTRYADTLRLLGIEDPAVGSGSRGPEVPESSTTAVPGSPGPRVPGASESQGLGVRSPRGLGSPIGRVPGIPGLGDSESSGPPSDGSPGPGTLGPRVLEGASPRVPGPQGTRVLGSPSAGESAGADPRWTDELGAMARQIVADLRALSGGARPSRSAFLEELRQRGGGISSRNRAALYAFALAPDVPSEADLDDTDALAATR